MPTLTTTQTTEVKLAPALKTKLTRKLKEYTTLKGQRDGIDAAMKKLSGEMGEIRDEAGTTSLKLDGVGTITLIASTFKKFNPKRYVSLGGDLAVYEQSIDIKPKKPYNKVTLPGEKAESDE